MAAKAAVNDCLYNVEPVVNHWILDCYFAFALDNFKKDKYEEFLGIRHVLDSK